MKVGISRGRAVDCPTTDFPGPPLWPSGQVRSGHEVSSESQKTGCKCLIVKLTSISYLLDDFAKCCTRLLLLSCKKEGVYEQILNEEAVLDDLQQNMTRMYDDIVLAIGTRQYHIIVRYLHAEPSIFLF